MCIICGLFWLLFFAAILLYFIKFMVAFTICASIACFLLFAILFMF